MRRFQNAHSSWEKTPKSPPHSTFVLNFYCHRSAGSSALYPSPRQKFFRSQSINVPNPLPNRPIPVPGEHYID